MPRFVVLRHEVPPGRDRPSHWDLMLEQERSQTLRTWALAELPDGPQPIEAEALPDHRLAYLEYEGPVSNDRGEVARWDQGTYRVLEESAGLLRVEFAGEKLRGLATLSRRADEGADSQRWVFSVECS